MNGAEDGYVNESKESSEAGISKMMDESKPGVTVMLYSDRGYHYWGATIAGTPASEFRAISHSTNHGLEESPVLPTHEEAKAHFLLRASEFVQRVTGRPCAPGDLRNLNFVRA